MFRRSIAGLALAATFLVACGTGTPAVSDPREIVTQGFAAMADLKSFHMDITVDGTLSIPELGSGEMTLNGTTLGGDFDLENQAAHMTFAVPSMLGLSGEMILVGEDAFVRTSMTGDKWMRSDASTASDPLSAAMDPEEISANVGAFLDKDGVEVEKLDDTSCGDSTCYSVRLTIPSSTIDDSAASSGFSAGDMFGDSLVLDLLFDKDAKYLSGVSTSFSTDAGSGTLSLTLSDFGESVDVSPPPSDQVTDGTNGFPF